jgi:hypothetical protein
MSLYTHAFTRQDHFFFRRQTQDRIIYIYFMQKSVHGDDYKMMTMKAYTRGYEIFFLEKG